MSGFPIKRRARGGFVAPAPSPSPTPGPTPTPTPTATFKATSNWQANGPTQFLWVAWVQAASMHARLKTYGINTVASQFANFTGDTDASWIASAKANGLFRIYSPLRYDGNTGDDNRAADMADDTCIAWMIADEPDGVKNAGDWATLIEGTWKAATGQRKPVVASFISSNIYQQRAYVGGRTTAPMYDFLASTSHDALGGDTYQWHYISRSMLPRSDFTKDGWFVSSFNWGGPDPATVPNVGQGGVGHGFTTHATGMAADMLAFGPQVPGESPPGTLMPPLALPSRKPTFQYITTGRGDFTASGNVMGFANSGFHQPGRQLRMAIWSPIIHGVSGIWMFPQTMGFIKVTGSITSNVLTITAFDQTPHDGRVLWDATATDPTTGNPWAFNVKDSSGSVTLGRMTAQNTGTAGSTGTYQLAAGAPNTASGTLYLFPGDFGNCDGTNQSNKLELQNAVANVNLMQAHPSGGNLMMDTVNGGRRACTIYRCPDTNGDPNANVDNMTLNTPRTPDATGKVVAGWPMGFEGFEVTGNDGKKYRIVMAMSTNATTSFTYSAWGVSGMSFGPCEVKMFTDASQTNQFAKAGVDD